MKKIKSTKQLVKISKRNFDHEKNYNIMRIISAYPNVKKKENYLFPYYNMIQI